MGEETKISWCNATFNPWRGCTKVSAGCQHCYAETFTKNRMGLHVWGPTASRQAASESYWKQPVKWNQEARKSGVRPRVFCASLADVFEGPETCQNPDAYKIVSEGRARLFELIESTRNLDWLLLTKRPENILRFTDGGTGRGWDVTWPENVWIGTTVENQEAADKRVPELLKVPASVRFLSCEPLLGPVTLWDYNEFDDKLEGPGMLLDGGMQPSTPNDPAEYWEISEPGIDWVIVGGESGPGARPMHLDWARSLRDQCVNVGVPFHFKQWGESVPALGSAGLFVNAIEDCYAGANPNRAFGARDHDFGHGYAAMYVGKKAAGRLMDGREWNEFPTDTTAQEAV